MTGLDVLQAILMGVAVAGFIILLALAITSIIKIFKK